MKKWFKEYGIFILLGLLIIASFIGNGWQHEQREDLKKAIKTQDSIIIAKDIRIKVLEDSADVATKDAIGQNSEANEGVRVIYRDKQQMHEEISGINDLSSGEQLDTFARLAEDYQPPR